jgi:hypothetical protein
VPDAGPEPATPEDSPTALPPVGARILAFVAILIGGLCGGLIGFAFMDLQCGGDCATSAGVGGLVGAIVGAAGVGVISVLALRAMGEWHRIQDKQ